MDQNLAPANTMIQLPIVYNCSVRKFIRQDYTINQVQQIRLHNYSLKISQPSSSNNIICSKFQTNQLQFQNDPINIKQQQSHQHDHKSKTTHPVN